MQESEIKQNLKVVSGNPSPEELAVIVALLEQVHREEVKGAKQVKQASSTWSRVGRLRTDLALGANTWRAPLRSGLE
ncbi:MAG: hypothetical protein RIQ88_954 [Actinomycetota bacterium]|jgi:hypothetical protein